MISLYALQGCATTRGISDPDNKKQSPYFFSYTGTLNECKRDIKLILFNFGFTIANEDTSINTIITAFKPLNEDERIDPGFGAAIFGIRSAGQRGSIRIQFEATDTATMLSIESHLQATIAVNRNAFREDKSESEDIILPQGHPLQMKIRYELKKNKKFKLIQTL